MQTTENWLSQFGLGNYIEPFVQNDVDLRTLPHIKEANLQQLGVSLGTGAPVGRCTSHAWR
jgi:hypothetical protein